MKKILKNITVFVITIFVITGCEDDFDITDPTAFTLEDVLELEDGFELLSLGVIDAYQKVVNSEYLVLELRSDNTVANTLNGTIADINSYAITATEGNSANYYSNNLQTIAKANQVIDNRNLATEDYQYTIGEAYFMRALCHFNIVRAYLNVPYIDSAIDVASSDILNYPQLDPSEVYAKIIEDFSTSIAYLQLSPVTISKRPSSNAAIALMAKAYLSQPDPNYAEAEALLSSIIGQNSLITTTRAAATDYNLDGTISDGEYYATLSENFGEVFGNEIVSGDYDDTLGVFSGATWDNNDGLEDNDEVLFQIGFTADTSADDISSADPTLDSQVETDSEIFSWEMATRAGLSNGINTASLDFLTVMNATDQPVRFEGTIQSLTFNDLELDTETFNSKFPIKTTGEGEGNGNDWIVIRYADVLLLYAEAILAGEDQTTNQSAIDSYNEVRERAGLETLPLGSVLTSDQLLEERRVEFAFENQRLFDLIRFGVVDDVLSAFSTSNSLNYTPSKAYLPFPQREIDATNGFYNQNPGY